MIVFVGDPAQLPPVCKHNFEQHDDICQLCHITSSPFWSRARRHHLNRSVRQVSDPQYVEFLSKVRNGTATQADIDFVLGPVMYDSHQAWAKIKPGTRFICTHRDQVATFNETMLNFNYPQAEQLHMTHNCHDCPDMQDWLNEEGFHVLTRCSTGAPVMLTTNLDLGIGACNGATGIVTEIKHDPQGRPTAIVVQLDSGNTIPVYRMMYKTKHHAGKRFYKATWPLSLAYAMTRHKCQGATITNDVCIIIKQVFTPGLMYVMLTRVLSRKQLIILGRLTVDMLKPVPQRFLQ